MKKFLALTALAFSTTLAGVVPASAFQMTESTLRSFNGSLRNFENLVKDVQRRQAEAAILSQAERSSYIDKSIQAENRLMDGSNQNAAMLARQQARAAAESGIYDPDPNACIFVDLFLGTRAERAVAGPGETIVGGVMAKITAGESRKGPAAAAAEVVSSVTPVNVGGMAIADGSTDLRYLNVSSAIDINDPQISQAYQAALRNLIDAVPDRPVTEAELQADPTAVVRGAEQQGRVASQGIAGNIFASTINLKTAQLDAGPFNALLQSADVQYNRPMGDKVSTLQELEGFVLATYATPKPRSTNPSEVLQEWRRALEIEVRQDYLNLEMQMRQAEAEAALLARLTR